MHTRALIKREKTKQLEETKINDIICVVKKLFGIQPGTFKEEIMAYGPEEFHTVLQKLTKRQGRDYSVFGEMKF